MKKTFKTILFLAIILIASCRKEEFNSHSFGTPGGGYASLEQFCAQNGPKMQFYIVDASSGGGFVTPQGTTVHVPASAFVNSSNQTVTGQVLICFKDLYKKSDMLLSRMPTMYSNGWPLKSGGEFFIKATQFNQPLQLAPGKKIEIMQPAALTGGQVDSAMIPLVVQQDTMNNSGWNWNPDDSLAYTTSQYIFSLYDFENPADSGTWCNSDNPFYFSTYTQVHFNAHATDSVGVYRTDVFLVFTGVSSMVHVYRDWTTSYSFDFPYQYAPQGLQATLVAMGVKDGKFYSSFTPVTISANMNVNFTLTESTADAFKAQLEALN